jgi:hypothetical protein
LTLCCAVALAQGCVSIEHPLSDVADKVRAKEFEGEWLKHDPVWGISDEPTRIVATTDGGCGVPDLCKASSDGVMETKLIAAAGMTFVEVKLTSAPSEDLRHATSYLASIERRGDWIAIRQLDKAAVQRFIEKGELEGVVTKGIFSNSITITSQPKAFRDFIAAHRLDVFEDRYDLYQLKSDDTPETAQPL